MADTPAPDPLYVAARRVLLDALALLTPHGDAVIVPMELIVPEGASTGEGRRGARIPPHGKRAAQRAVGLEAALVTRREASESEPDAEHFGVRRCHRANAAAHNAKPRKCPSSLTTKITRLPTRIRRSSSASQDIRAPPHATQPKHRTRGVTATSGRPACYASMAARNLDRRSRLIEYQTHFPRRSPCTKPASVRILRW